MGTKNYLVREGFVVVVTLEKPDGSKYDRTYTGGEKVSLDDDQAALHAHKLEFASKADIDAALAAEQEAKVTAQAASSPVELVQTLVAALQQSIAANQAPAAAAAA